MGVNISFPLGLLERIDEYTAARAGKGSGNRSAFIQYAVEKVLNTESPDYKREVCLERAIQRWVAVPFPAPIQSVYGFMYMLATRYPNVSAKDFWTDAVFVGPRAVTHKELLSEVRRDFEVLIAGA